MANKTENEKPPIIVIKRIKKGGGGHHGGAWKVAYADFVTAMMAFFLLLWLLNVTTEEQKNAISNYFDPSHPKVSDVTSGAGGILAGMTMSPDGAMVSTVQPIVQPEQPDTTTRGELQGMSTPGEDTEGSAKSMTEEQLEKELRKKEDERFKAAAEKLKAEMMGNDALKELMNNVLIDITPEGLRIQIVDDKGRSMFPSGSAVMYDFMRQILLAVTKAVNPLPNQISVRGHTDSVKYREPNNYDNWNLSADRAQASRRVMVQGGLPEKRIENVMGRSDREPLVPAEPANPRNRRITIILLREKLTQAARPLPGKETPAIKADKKETQAPAKEGKLPGIEIVDDTLPVPKTVAGGAGQSGAEQSDTAAPAASGYKGQSPRDKAAAQEQELPPGYVPLPVMPGGTPTSTQPKSVTFGDAPAKDSSGSLYEGPVQSPYVNKPPTIRTPVFNLDNEDMTQPAKPLDTPPPSTATSPARNTGTNTGPAQKAVTFGDIPAPEPLTLKPMPKSDAQAPLTPKVLSISPILPEDDTPELRLIQPKQQSPKAMTFGAPAETAPETTPETRPITTTAPAQPQSPATTSSPDKKTLTFD